MTITAFTLPVIPAPAADAVVDPEARAAFIADWHDLGAVLANHRNVPLPFDGRLDPVTIHFLAGDDPGAKMNAAAAVIGCEWREGISDCTETEGGVYRELRGELRGGLKLMLIAPLDDDGDEDAASAQDPSEPESDAGPEADDGNEAA